MNDILIITLIGAFIGTSAGMLGIGGALAATPLLKILIGLPPLLALASPLPATLPSALSGAIVYHKNKLIDFKLAWWVLLSAIPMNILGTKATQFIPPLVLMYFTGGFIFMVGCTFFVRGWMLREEADKPTEYSVLSAIITGLITGTVSGVLAIGGGIIMIPAFVKINKLRVKSAFATSLFCIAVLAIPGSIGHYLLGHIDMKVMVILMITVAPFSYIGARIAIRLQSKTLEKVFGTFMIALSLYFLFTQ
ncbi:MAG: sulfite exporter TauE/SafE family protein [Ignavibacteria bacterium]|nr:sulfite exporter TauE/SafE family protein [Ignavibacteria bacterium]